MTSVQPVGQMKIPPDYLYSDPHFGHSNIIKFCDRPYQDMSEMISDFVHKYNETVPKGAFTLWLGDCFFGAPAWGKAILDSLNGRKALIRGNHDRSVSRANRLGFECVLDELVFTHEGIRFRCCHYPHLGIGSNRFIHLRSLPKKGEVLLHGHTHSPEKTGKNSIHVGVDAWGYRPVAWYEVLGLARKVLR